MQDLILRVLEVIDALLLDGDGTCNLCYEEDSVHTPDCELGQLLEDLHEALEDPFNS